MLNSPAAIIVILSSTWFFTVPESTPANKRTLTFSYMADTKNYGKDDNFSITSGKSIFDASISSTPTELLGIRGLRFGVSGMYDMQGTYMFGPGIGKTVDIGKFDTTLFIYPSYSSIHGLDRGAASGSMNLRTTFDVTYRFDDKMKAGVGVMHISNSGYQEPNRGIEAVRFTLGYDF
jgi:hypothetical protein